MECNNIQEKLSAYMEGTVSPDERMRIDEHLKSCPKCSESLADLRKALEHVQGLEEVEPPPWLTQKVMARVKAETELKRGIFQRLLYPLHIKLPIEAVAVVLIAITTVYVFKAVQPEMERAKVPLEEFKPRILSEEKEKAVAHDEGKPLPRKPADQFRVVEERKIAVGKRAEAPGPPARVATREKVAPSAGAVAKGEAKPQALPYGMKLARVEGKREGISLTINVKETKAARKELQKALAQLGGEIIKTEYFENRNVITAEIDSKKMKELFEKLELVGEIGEKTLEAWEGQEGNVEIRIEVSRKP